MQANRFEDLIAWQKSRALTKAVYEVMRIENFARDYRLAGQIQRAAVSIMSNLAEGFERGSNRDFHRFLCIAKASCAELRSQLYIAYDIGYIEAEEFTQLHDQAIEVSRVISGLLTSIQRVHDDSKDSA